MEALLQLKICLRKTSGRIDSIFVAEKQLVKQGAFVPYISTKVPIDEKTIVKYKEVGMKKLQVSIDSFNPEIL
ncbi:MAG: hypothetical protein LBC89_03495, partial [Bacteroidales bacterium]|nr:hypothetical protein [Bacteroidales bacterium]